MRLAVTGHRPNKLGGYHLEVRAKLVELMRPIIHKLQPELVYTGMAQGLDQAVAYVCIQENIPFIACIPCDNQDALWPVDAKKRYATYLARAKEVINVAPGPYAAYKMQLRNEYMIDHCDHLVALWDGSSGGTANCVNYAVRKHIPVTQIWSLWDK